MKPRRRRPAAWLPLLVVLAAAAAHPAHARAPGSPGIPELPGDVRPAHRGSGAVRPGTLPSAGTTEFTPVIDGLVTAVSPQRLMGRIAELSGAAPIVVASQPETLVTRYTYSPGARIAGDWIAERFAALGYDVEQQWFQVGASTVANVVAERRGLVRPDEIYVIGAHYDSRSQLPMTSAPGANDNASGTACVLEAARVFASVTSDATVRFVCFGAEEQGLLGSYEYVARARAAGDSIAGAIILDMIAWWQNSYAIQVEGGYPWEWLQDVMSDACNHYTGLGAIKTFYSWGSDHVPFQEAGYPAFLAIEDEWDSYACYHRSCDVASSQKADMVADVTRASVAALASLARVSARTGVAVRAPAAGLPAFSAAPNPAGPATAFHVELDAAHDVRIDLYDTRGRLVTTAMRAPLPAGRHALSWQVPADLAPGLYLARLTGAGPELATRLIIAR